MKFDNFFSGKKVLITGHTGFKGSWLTIWLLEMGAKVIGYSLDPYKNGVFDKANLKEKIVDIRADIRDFSKLENVFVEHKPDIVIHMAAQAITRHSYDEPRETFETNIMGSVNILECIRMHPVKSAVIITSDKCYKNKEIKNGYIESDEMSDKDPYSCSKGCTELIVGSYRNSFGIKIPSARAGNVIGGGDWGMDRLVPDIVRSLKNNEEIAIRNPDSVRPWQFVLEPLSGYLLLAKMQYNGKSVSEGWNFGPEHDSMVSVKELAGMIIKEWRYGKIKYYHDASKKKEAGLLYLNCGKSKKNLGWKPSVDIAKTVSWIVEWYKNYEKKDAYALCVKQIKEYEKSGTGKD